MLKFLKDIIYYPFEIKNKNNKCNQIFGLLLKDYPAFLWTKPHWRRIVAFPFIVIAKIFEKNTGKNIGKKTL